MSLSAIKGAKAGQEKPHQPSIAKDDIASISKVKILYALSEGEVKGLANGAASIMLDGTPLLDSAGQPNFENVEWEIRNGTVDQTHIAGLPSLSSEIGIGTILRSGTPWIRTITNTQLSSANVNVSWARLSETTDKFDVIGTKVAYAIDIQTDGNGYVTVLDTSIKAKTSGRYQRTHNIKLPEAQQGWQIRVRKITADGDNERKFNQMQIDSIAEIIDAKLRYPHTALLYLSFDARAFSNMPKMTVDMYGRYLKVPVNYDPVSRTSTGIWNGTFKTAYSNNPGWVYYDLITNDRYGLGERLKPFMIHKFAIAHIARICDEPVSDGKGGTEPRFTCNLYLQVAEQAYQVLQHIAAIFRGMSFWNGAQIILDADTPRDVDYVITRANVVDGQFNKSGTAIDDRHTLAQVAWSNPENNYETDYAMVRNERAIAKYGINPLEMPVVGCTSEGQAYRAGLAALLSEQNRTQTVTFTMGLDGSLPTVGNRVDIADMMFTGVNNGGRISAVNANRTVITVDRDDIPATTGDRLSVNLESGRAQTREILSVSGRNITVKTPFDPVAAENVWAVDSDELPTMSFIVLSITENEDRTQYTYTALQYDAGLYAQIDNGTIIEPRPPAPPFNPYIIQAPDSVTVSSRNRVVQAQNVTTFVIVWDQVKDAVAYDVEWRKDDGDWIKLPRTGNISVEIDGVYSGNYIARVSAVSAFDAVSKQTTSMLTAITGKAGKPPKLLALKAIGLLFGMQLDWTFSPGSDDTAYTEIQVASAPDVNVATLGQFAYSTDTHTINGLQGGLTQHYRGRIVDKLGNTSDWTTWVSATTDQSADKVLDLIQGQITGSSLDQALTSQIDKIAVNETAIIAANKAIAAETQARIDAILAANDAITAERDARTADILDANNKITAEQQARTADVLAANDAISTEQQARVAEILATNNAINAETQARIDAMLAANDAITAERDARIEGLLAAEEGITTETTQRKASDEALGKRIDTVITKTDGNTAAIQTEVTARTDADTALSSRIDTVVAQSDGNTAAISSEVTARTNADSALSTRIDTVSSK
ncbi:host specificity protein J, partial [Psychrobacter sp. UBA6291]|uniref:host specificity protein J n=1 Tax=Psychrobacter sp. UBA6291 TaxID=1947357 RepID=UPI00257CF954